MNYLYVINVPVVLKNGQYIMPRSAAMDLLAHKRLLPQSIKLILAAPVISPKRAEDFKGPMDPIPGIEVKPLYYENSIRQGILSLVPNFIVLSKAVKEAGFVHTGCGGFPFFLSPCFQAHCISLNKEKPLLFIMDCDLVGKIETDQIPRASNRIKKWIWRLFAILSWRLYTWCLQTATVTFLLGRGVVSRYGPYAKKPLEIYQPIIGYDSILSETTLKQKLEEIIKSNNLSCCFAGRLVPEKGVDVMLEAVAILKRKGITIRLNIFGDGPQKKEYEALARKLHLENEIVFHGQKEWGQELFTELRKAHIQIVPHLTLEMTRNVFDGMANGCALVVSETEALKALIEDSRAGICFETGNSGALAGSLISLIKNREALVAFIKEGIDFVKKNHRDAHIKRRLDYLAKEIPAFSEKGL